MRNLLLALAVALCFFGRCSCGAKNVAGTTTESETGKPCAVLGVMVYSDGRYVVGADVRLIDQAKANLMVIGLAKSAALIRGGDTITDRFGFFEFDSVDTGRYRILVNDHDSLGGLFSAEVKPADTLVRVDGTLVRLGGASGRLDTSLISKTLPTYIYVVEVDLKVPVANDGSFNLGVLPPGTYTLKLIYGTAVQASPLDTMPLPVKSDSTTVMQNVGTKFGVVVIRGTVREEP